MRDDEEQVFAEALRKKAPDELAAFLDQACDGDSDFRGAIESLLAAHDQARQFLESPAVGLGDGAHEWIRELSAIASDGSAAFDPIRPNVVIGDYQLLEQIGEGGMGVVYLAEQRRLSRRKVAVKIIKPGMDSRQVVGRFETERHALSMMDHPNIARVLDAGTTHTGRPYFVMEWVSGLPITRYCDENGCTTAERLRLFLQVCHAIEHAHQKGVIHRDLKPSNVMVTLVDGNPVPKVIDFGVAKATDGAQADATRRGQTLTVGPAQVLGTPMYMSPEQAALAGDVDTRSDVYSLGVLLYELLCGLPPFDRRRLADAPLDEVRRIIREERPPRPSLRTRAAVAGSPPAQSRAAATPPDAPHHPADTPATTLQNPAFPHPTPPARHPRPTPARPDPLRLARVLRGDLDCITGKAMAKDRALRYTTADALACDVQRYLDGEPILARPPSAAYRVGKFFTRNKLAVSAAAALLTLLVLGVVGTSTAAVWALRARDLARQHQRRAEDAARDSAATADFIEQVLASANPWDAAWNPARADATVEPLSLRQVLDQTSKRVASGALKDQPAVEARVRTALAAGYSAQGIYFDAQQHLQAVLNLRRSAPVVDELQLAQDMLALAEVLAIQGRDPQAVRLAAGAVAIRRRTRRTPPALIADALDTESRALRVFGDFDAARARATEARELRDHLPAYPAAEADCNRSNFNLAMALARQGDDDNALPMLRTVLEADRRLLKPGHPQVATDLYNLALLYRRANGHLKDAIDCLHETVDLRRKYLAEEEQEVSTAVLRLSQFLRAAGRYEEAQTVLQDRERRLPAAQMPPRRRLELLREWVALYQDWGGHDAQLTAAGARLQDELIANRAEVSARLDGPPAASQPSGELWALYYNRGRIDARLGQFQDAVSDISTALAVNPDAFDPRACRAAIHAYLGQRALYDAECADLVQRYADSEDHLQLGLVVHVAAMFPGAVDPELLCRLTDRLVKLRATDQRLMPRARLLQGVAAYRAGRYDDAAALLHDTRLLEYTSERLTADLFAAMADHQAGRVENAKTNFLAATKRVDHLLPRPGLGDPEDGDLATWILCNLAYREAAELIDEQAPGAPRRQ